MTDARPPPATSPNTPIVLTHVGKSYVTPPNLVVKNLSVAIREGEIFCFIGPSGCGKSTVIKMIAGIEAPTQGDVVRPKQVGMVFQSYALLPWLTAEANVALALRMQGRDAKAVKDLTRKYLRMVQLQAFAASFPRELSGGQKQRIGIARALAVESQVLLMDEPFSALDPVMTDELHQDVLRIWGATRKTIVMVSHNFSEAIMLADRIGVMRDGRLREIVDVALPRPRRESDEAFTAEVHKLRTLLEPAPAHRKLPAARP